MAASHARQDENKGSCQILDASYIPACAQVMAHAFCDSPSYNYIFRGTRESRIEAIAWVLTQNMHLTIRKCPTALRGILRDGQVVVCFLWTPSEHQKLTLMEMIGAGLWQIPFRFGWSTMTRLLDLMEAMKRKHETDDSFIMLERMVVRPDCQGQGWGSRALKTTLESEPRNVPIRLSTQEERNVRFYQRLGFQVVHDQEYFADDPEFKFHSWAMVRTKGNP